MRRSLYVVSLSFLATTLASCMATGPAPTVVDLSVYEPETEVEIPQAPSLLSYYAWLRAATQEELVAERQRLELNGTTEDDYLVALRHGLLLLASGVLNGQREAAVLEGLGSDLMSFQTEENRALGVLVSTQIRLRRQVQAVPQEPGALPVAEVEHLRAENVRLQEQINALTTIEQQLIERELQDAQQPRQP